MELNTISPIVPCIKVQNAYKNYGPENTVLNGLNLTVPKSAIYSLLGPSGCGKTTLINCLIGSSRLNSGSIELSITTRKQLGFMPQTVSLYAEFTILENMMFYGYLFGMQEDEIRTEAAKLIDLLDLPTKDSLVENLSGGQQRRVSLSLSFLHDPDVLILDEPTVGLDIALTTKIWEKFLNLSSNGKTILITTHYIQEADKGHWAGMMRNGFLVAEETPQKLLEKCNCLSLEDVFVYYSQKQEESTTEFKNYEVMDHQMKIKRTLQGYFKQDERLFSKPTMKGVYYKNFTQIKRSYFYIVFALIFPIFQFLLFYVTFGHTIHDVKVAVINNETFRHENDSQITDLDYDYGNFRQLNDSQSNDSKCFLENPNILLSLFYINSLQDKDYKLIVYDNVDEAISDAKKNKVWGVLYFPHNFTSTLRQFVHFKFDSIFENIIAAELHVWLDFTGFIGYFTNVNIVLALLSTFEKAVADCGLKEIFSELIPIKFEKPLYGKTDLSFVDYAVPISQIIFSFGISMLGAGIIGVNEKLSGTIERMLTAGVSVFELLISIMTYQLIICVIQTTVMTYLIYGIINIENNGNIFLLTSLVLLNGILGIISGVFFMVLFGSMLGMAMGGTMLSFFLLISTGIVWPVEGQHKWLKWIHSVFPFGYATDAARAIVSKSYTVTDGQVILGFGMTFAWILIILICVCLVLKYKPDVWVLKVY